MLNVSNLKSRQLVSWFIGFVSFFICLISMAFLIVYVMAERPDELLPISATETRSVQAPDKSVSQQYSPAVTDVGQDRDAGLLDQTGTIWAPYLEWSLENPEYSGNPFDLVAVVSFTHAESGETRQTEMFYAGDDVWKFRFTGTRTGEWTFTTSSNDLDLHGYTGQITIYHNPDLNIKGFLVTDGSKFARQVGENGELEGVILNIWRNGAFPLSIDEWYESEDLAADLQYGIDNYIHAHGMNTLSIGSTGNRWFNLETQAWDKHDSEDPDLRTFEALEEAIVYLHSQGVHLHLWAWGDEQRKWTPIGVGGINGIPDKRLQRYIAARLGPLPGWSMGYGFDLFEWVTDKEVEEWGDYLQERMGWPHLLAAREENTFHTPDNMDIFSTDERVEEGFYDNAVAQLEENAGGRPVLYSRRFMYNRDNVWSMGVTRQAMWQFAMVGGAAGWWGITEEESYPNPEQMHAHGQFWKHRFLLSLERANELTDGYALKDGSNLCYIFYKEGATSLQMNLSGMVGPQRAVAVDTRLAYVEIDLGILAPTNQTWNAPYQSDWAIAVGDFDRQATVASDFQAEPLDLPNNSYLPLITRGIAADRCGY